MLGLTEAACDVVFGQSMLGSGKNLDSWTDLDKIAQVEVRGALGYP